ncbi:MAG: glycosyltransferase [Verrucomicrobia bacterium]|nr:glycosyltransferase [Verrucomicrobiota bacterium]
MKRLLLVSPHFPPVNAPDHQRVRTMLPYLRARGWEPVVLAASPVSVQGATLDATLEETYPRDLEIIRVDALPHAWTRRLGLGTLGLRVLPAMARRGSELLRQRKFDAAFFSTAQFTVMALGPRWRKTHGLPYLLDFHDPWLAEPASRGNSARPGGWKYRLAQWQAAMLEPRAVRGAAHCVCVSEAYPRMLRARYPEVEAQRFSVLPFGASEEDLRVGREFGRQEVFDPADGRLHLVCTGIVEAPFLPPLRTFFKGLQLALARDQAAARLAVHFVGTTYAPNPSGEGLVTQEARAHGLTKTVTEQRSRVPYFSALKCWHDAAALLVFGSADASYVPSKLEPSVAAGRPVLSLFHPNTPPRARLEAAGAWVADLTGSASEEMVADFLLQLVRGSLSPCPKGASFGAAEMTAKFVHLLEQCSA